MSMLYNDLALKKLDERDDKMAFIYFFNSYILRECDESIYNLARCYDIGIYEKNESKALDLYFEYICVNKKNNIFIKHCYINFLKLCSIEDLNNYLNELSKKGLVGSTINILQYMNLKKVYNESYLSECLINLRFYNIYNMSGYKKSILIYRLYLRLNKRLKFLYLSIFLNDDIVSLVLNY